MTNALPQQTEFPGIDPVMVRLTLASLLEHYNDRVANAESGAQVQQLVRDYAKACLREIGGMQGREFEDARAHFRDILTRTEEGESP